MKIQRRMHLLRKGWLLSTSPSYGSTQILRSCLKMTKRMTRWRSITLFKKQLSLERAVWYIVTEGSQGQRLHFQLTTCESSDGRYAKLSSSWVQEDPILKSEQLSFGNWTIWRKSWSMLWEFIRIPGQKWLLDLISKTKSSSLLTRFWILRSPNFNQIIL